MVSWALALVLGAVLVLVGGWGWRGWALRQKHLTCRAARSNGETYCVRRRPTRAATARAVELLARVADKCQRLVDACADAYADDARYVRLKAQFRKDSIDETLPTDEHTAYSDRKGEHLAFCLQPDRHRARPGESLVDENTLTFVALHELSHIMTLSQGHTQEFWRNFADLLAEAKDLGVYQPVDYRQRPQAFCGITIDDNPYFDRASDARARA